MSTDLLPGVCRKTIGHPGRCSDGLGGSWEGAHPATEEAERYKRWFVLWQQRAYAAEAALERLTDAVALLLAAAPDETAAVKAASNPDQLSLLEEAP